MFFFEPIFRIINLDKHLRAFANLSNSALILDLGCGVSYGIPIIRRTSTVIVLI